MKVTTPRPDLAGFPQQLARAESERARLAAEERQVSLQRDADQAELQTLLRQAEAHATQKRQAQETLTARRQALREAETRAELAMGTLSQTPDVTPLEQALHQAQQDQLALLDRIGKEAQAQERRRQALADAADRHQLTLVRLAEKKAALEAARTRIQADYGQARYQTHLQTLRACQQSLSTAEQAAGQAREESERLVREATADLAPWPALQADISAQLPYQDSLTRILEHALALVNAILTEGRGAEIPLAVSRKLNMRFLGLAELLAFDAFPLRSAFHATMADVSSLDERKTQMETILRTYREMQR